MSPVRSGLSLSPIVHHLAGRASVGGAAPLPLDSGQPIIRWLANDGPAAVLPSRDPDEIDGLGIEQDQGPVGRMTVTKREVAGLIHHREPLELHVVTIDHHDDPLALSGGDLRCCLETYGSHLRLPCSIPRAV